METSKETDVAIVRGRVKKEGLMKHCPYWEIDERERNGDKKLVEVTCCSATKGREICHCEGDKDKCDDPGRLAQDKEE